MTPLLSLGTSRNNRLARCPDLRCVFETQPIRNLLGIEAHSPPDMEARKFSTSGHAVDVFVINAEKFAQL